MSPTTRNEHLSRRISSRITVALRAADRAGVPPRARPCTLGEGEDAVYHNDSEDSDAEFGILATNARIPAPQSRSAKKWTICLQRRRHTGGGGVTGRALGPSRSRRAAASVVLSPLRDSEDVGGAGTSLGFQANYPVARASRHSPSAVRALSRRTRCHPRSCNFSGRPRSLSKLKHPGILGQHHPSKDRTPLLRAAPIRRLVRASPSPLPCHLSSTAAAYSALSDAPSRSKLTTAMISPSHSGSTATRAKRSFPSMFVK